ncbi:two-component sensor histidine kinase [Croceivirga lutea]|uniref:tetratricopeptide repeat-containing sensor histidine kinase n=1 Tax=Croceivirga lutea TaxID=1775167 RepID=UPI00163958A9|nr:ATP-binding protein [Croceivirga lutea]GGG46671.1 two-component sensor histidine kinase [Croceivirga lutea]
MLKTYAILLTYAACLFTTSYKPIVQDNDKEEFLNRITSTLESDVTNEEKLAFLNSSLNKIETFQGNEKLEVLSTLSSAFLKIGDTTKFKSLNKQTQYLSQKSNNYYYNALSKQKVGDYFKNQKHLDSAFYYYISARRIIEGHDFDLNSKNLNASILYDIALIQHDTKDYVRAEETATKYVNYVKVNEITQHYFTSYNLTAIIQNGLKNFDKAFKYHQIAKEQIKFLDEDVNEIYSIYNTNNFASTYARAENYKKADSVYQTLLQNKDLINLIPKTYVKAKSGYLYANFKLGKFTSAYFEKEFTATLQLIDSLGLEYEKPRVYQYYAEVLLAANKKEQAIAKVETAVDIAKATENNDRLLELYEFLIAVEEIDKRGYGMQYVKLQNQLINEERSFREKFALIELETEETEQENIKLQKRSQLLIGVSIGLLVLGVGVITIVLQRIVNQRLRFEKTQQESNQEIYKLMLAQRGKLEQGKKAEQRRISEELHDGVLGEMLGIRLIMSGLNERSDQEAINQRDELIQKLQGVEEEIRMISHELNKGSYEKVDNFNLALIELLSTSAKSSGIKIETKYSNEVDWELFDSNTKINIYRIVQEIIQNSIKHSKAKNIDLQISKTAHNLRLNIIDNGKGFDLKKKKTGIGIKNIRSRIEKLNGKVNFRSTLGKGTKVEVIVPIKNNVENSKADKESTSFNILQAE